MKEAITGTHQKEWAYIAKTERGFIHARKKSEEWGVRVLAFGLGFAFWPIMLALWLAQ